MKLQSSPRFTPYARLFYWVAVSLFFHIALVTFVGGAREIPFHRPLQVELLHIPPEAAGPMTKPGIVQEIDARNPLPQAPTPDAAREIAHPAESPKPAIDLPIVFENYLRMNEVDVRAEPANDVPLSYPTAAYMRRIEGVVRLNLFINAQGKLDRIDLVEASPKGIFENAAIETVSKLYFHPAIRNGRPVKSQKTIDVVFDPYEDVSKPMMSPQGPSAAGK